MIFLLILDEKLHYIFSTSEKSFRNSCICYLNPLQGSESRTWSLKKMRGAVFVAVAAAIGNMLQGWDNSVIAGMSHI